MIESRVLILARYYIPGVKAGGPIRSIFNLVDFLKNDFRIKILTSDRDYLDKFSYPNIQLNSWLDGKYSIFYSSKAIPLIRIFIEIRATKVVYINSFFDPIYSILPLIISLIFRRRIVLAPRGEFSKSALDLKKRKKSIYIFLFKILRFKNKVVWHATNIEELRQIEVSLGKVVNYGIANNISLKPSIEFSHFPKKEYLDLFFYGRIARMKNLKFAIKILSLIDKPIVFNIYGPIDDFDYWNECRAIIKRLPSNIQVNYKGLINRQDIKNVIWSHEFLFFPSKGENYSHVIAECLSYGTPVILSDKTPWRNLEIRKAGWDIALHDIKQFVQVINNLYFLGDKELFEFRRGALSFYKDIFKENERSLRQKYYNLFGINEP